MTANARYSWLTVDGTVGKWPVDRFLATMSEPLELEERLASLLSDSTAPAMGPPSDFRSRG